MGEVIRCVQSAETAESGSSDGTYDTCSAPTSAPGACPSIDLVTVGGATYECTAGDPECPPEESNGSAPEESGTQSDQGTSRPPTGDASEPSALGKGKGAANGRADGAKSSDFGSAGLPECSFVPELPYCGGGASSGECTKGNCDAPGKQKKNRDDGASSSSSSDAGSTSGGSSKGKKFRCVKDGKGNRSCESAPRCVPGTHPSACGACVPDGESGDCVPPAEGGCWVTGGGFIVGPNVTAGAAADGHDNFGGNAKPMKDGRVQGHWNHVDHGTGNHAKGQPEYIVCRRVDEPGPGQPGGKRGFTMNQVYFGGPAEWRSDGTWSTGYWFDVVAKDHGEPGSVPHAKNGRVPDTYHFTIRKMDDPTKQVSGAIVYETRGALEGGNIQLHPPNPGHPYTPMALPGWVAFEP